MNSQLPDTTLLLYDGKVTSYSDLLVIDEANLAAEYSRQAAWLGYIGVLTAEAEADYEKAKLDSETLYAETDARIRLDLAAKGVKITEDLVKSRVLLDDEYVAALNAKIESLKSFKMMKALETGMKEKGNMLVSLGATVRQEMDMTTLVSRIKKD